MDLLRNIFKIKHIIAPKIQISSLRQVVKVIDDTYNKVPNGETNIDFFDGDKNVGHLSLRQHNGQIGIIVLDNSYRRRGIGTQILDMSRDIILKYGNADTMWAVTTKDHKYWSNVPGMVWKEPAHESVTGPGYSVDINNKEFVDFIKKYSN